MWPKVTKWERKFNFEHDLKLLSGKECVSFEHDPKLQFKHILLPKYIQQWGWVISSHNISFDP